MPPSDELAIALRALLGARAPAPIDDAARAARLATEFAASRDAAVPSEWALLSRTWPADATPALVDTLHRLARNLGDRSVWLLDLGAPAQAVALPSAAVLDNPLGFAAATDHALALLDADVVAGLRLVRRAPDQTASDDSASDDTRDATWGLEVWGEPWLSATTRALRGVG